MTILKKSKGITLIEVMVASFIAAILTTIIYASFKFSQDYYWKTIDAKIEIQLNCIQALERIKADVLSSNISSFTTVDNSTLKAVSFQTPIDSNGIFQTDSATGVPFWQQYIIYYWTTSTTDLRRIAADVPHPSTAVAPLTPGRLTAYCDGTGGIMALDVSGFSVSVVGNYINFSLTNSLTYAGRNNQVQMSIKVYPVN